MMEKGELLRNIENYFANTPKEHLQKVYDELKEYNQYGPTVEEYIVLKRTLGKFMNERMQQEMGKLWDSGVWSNEKLQAMQSEHLRTAYK